MKRDKAAAGSETWIINGTLYTQDEQRKVFRKNIRIRNGVMDAITSRSPSARGENRGRGANLKIIDARGLTILPGFVQTHIHLCQTLFRNQADDMDLIEWLTKRIWLMEAAHTPETLYTSALLGINELLASGTTCILDMATVKHTESVFRAVRDTGIRASVGKCLMDHAPEIPSSSASALSEPTAQALEEAYQLYSKWNNKENDRIRASFAPRFAISCSDQLLKSVAKISRELNAIVHTHASENQNEIEIVRKRFGCENIECLEQMGLTSPRLVIAHGVWLNPKEQRILKRTGTHVTHCPSSNLKLASGIAPIPELKALGINVCLGADGAPCNNSLNIFNELKLAAILHKPRIGPKGMPATEVLDMATRNGAVALNWFDQIGSIEEGKKADLVAMDLNTLTNSIPEKLSLDNEAIASSIVYSSDPSHVKWTMVDGKMVYTNGKMSGFSVEKLQSLMRKAHKTISKGIR